MRKPLIHLTGLVLSISLLGGTLVQCTPNQTDSTTDTSENETTEVTVPNYDREVVETLGLCVTESLHNPGGQRGYELRFKEYVDMGIKTVRFETEWTSPGKGQWTLSDNSKAVISTAIESGLRLKLISPTIMNPPGRVPWVEQIPESKLISYKGNEAICTVSYWWDGIYEFTEDAINCQMKEYERLGYLDHMDGLIVDFGPAGEPLYPAAWTQGAGLENPENENSLMWCYGDNAVADFKEKMLAKYGSIDKINEAWGTTFASMDQFRMPAPNTVKGQQWEDVLTWYIETKREFIEKQIQIFKKAVDQYSDGRIQLILYMPGAAFTQDEWKECVATGGTTFAIVIGSENEFIVEMAHKYGCLLHFTGLPTLSSLKQVRQWMYANGYGHIPVIGENVASLGAAQSPEGLYQQIEDFNLDGIDYTFTNYLWEENFVTLSSIGEEMKVTVPKIADFIKNTDFAKAPYLLAQQEAKPEGDVLAMRAVLDNSTDSTDAMLRARIAIFDYEIQEGDVIEYDVKISVPSNGFGFVDGVVSQIGPLRTQGNCQDQFGISASTSKNLASIAGEKWVHRILGLDVSYNTHNMELNTPGKILRELCLLAQPYKINGSFQHTDVTVYYDNIKITNNGEVKLVIFESESDLKMAPVVMTQQNGLARVTVETYTP